MFGGNLNFTGTKVAAFRTGISELCCDYSLRAESVLRTFWRCNTASSLSEKGSMAQLLTSDIAGNVARPYLGSGTPKEIAMAILFSTGARLIHQPASWLYANSSFRSIILRRLLALSSKIPTKNYHRKPCR